MRYLTSSLLCASLAACFTQRSAVGPEASSSAPQRREALSFIEDDYPRALAEARARQVPLFVEAWAPW
jgi:hypothetical protein